MVNRRAWILSSLVVVAGVVGCEAPVHFPAEPAATEPGAATTSPAAAYDTDRDGHPDYFLFRDKAGRVDRIAFEPDASVPPGGCRIVTASCRVDATLEERAARIAELLAGRGAA